MPLPAATTREPAGARPVDVLADQRRLVAPGEAVDDVRLAGLARQQRARHRVRLDIDHDDVLAVRDRGERVTDAGLGHPGRLDHDLDRRAGDQRFGIVGEMGRPRLCGVAQRGRREDVLAPAGGAQLPLRAFHVEIGERDQMHAAGAAQLGEKHGAELAGTDQPDGDGPAGGFPPRQHGREIHGISLVQRHVALVR